MFVLNPQSGIPIYRQLVEQVRRLVAGGQLRAGDELPSVRELAVVHGVNAMTISKAYSLLEAEGLLERQRGKAMRIAVQKNAAQKNTADAEQQLLTLLQPQLEQLIMAAQQLGIGDTQLLALLKQKLNSNEKTTTNIIGTVDEKI